MLVLTPGGHERAHEEFQQLLASVGFKLTRIVRTGGPTEHRRGAETLSRDIVLNLRIG